MLKIKRLGNGKKFYSYNCSVCWTTIDAWEYEKNNGKCWRCAGSYDPY